jgi:predicted dienelactone hydrolase
VEEGIVEPVARGLYVRLRRAVLDHARTERRRRVFPPVLHVGSPGLTVAEFAIEPADPTDQALRTDIVSAMLRLAARRGDTPLVWLSRPGAPSEVRDVDLEWLAATRAAGAELGRHLPFVVINRRAWRDPRTGVGRVWQRLRDR